ncbi:ralA-binding protein 1 [Anoplophora glabripennis]|nr:ralA-binding protein 1 [Anoplophora glabripennis]
MDFDSPDVMKDFPGLYASELNKKCNNDSDYSDETEKGMKKDMLIGKRKDKKDKKDKERGYAALEGESSDETSKSRSPSKSKKTKSFKFTTKSKEKREKSRDKEISDKKKDRDKKTDKKCEKEKAKKVKQSVEETVDIADALPMFGVSLELAVERSRCHDGVDLPLPIRECIDYVEAVGISFEGVYKISGTKTKVSQIRKMYNHRQNVRLSDYDVPTATSLLKMFLRDLPEPIFTNDLLIRFEEAGAILNFNTREKHLKILVDNLPPLNKLLLSWLIVHLHNVSLNEKQNKMNKQSIAAALNHTFHISSRLLQALLHHSQALFPYVVIFKYIPPLGSGVQLPDKPNLMEIELKKQESLLTQIHKEMNYGCNSKEREELLWEVQRIVTQLKRKLKTVQKSKDVSEKSEEKLVAEGNKDVESKEPDDLVDGSAPVQYENVEAARSQSDNSSNKSHSVVTTIEPEIPLFDEQDQDKTDNSEEEVHIENNDYLFDDDIVLLTYKRNGLITLKEKLLKNMQMERNEIEILKEKLDSTCSTSMVNQIIPKQECLDEVMALLQKENQILQIKKINLVRQIIEQKELCIELSAQLRLASNDNYLSNLNRHEVTHF